MRKLILCATVLINMSFIGLGFYSIWEIHDYLKHVPTVQESELRRKVANQTTIEGARAINEGLLKMFSGAWKTLDGATSIAQTMSIALITLGIMNLFLALASQRTKSQHEPSKRNVA